MDGVNNIELTDSVALKMDELEFTLDRLELPWDPLKLHIGQQAFTFSVTSATDTRGSVQDAGAYAMNVKKSEVGTDTMMLVKEV